MSDENKSDTEPAAELAAARARSDEYLKALAETVAKRHQTAVLSLAEMVRHERWVADMALHRIIQLERLISFTDANIASLKAAAAGWRDVARRAGADVDDVDDALRSH